MPAITSFAGRSIGARLYLATGAIVLGAMLAAVGFTALRARQVANESAHQALAASLAAQGRFERQRAAQLRLISRFAATDPSFVAYVAESDPVSVHDLLLERQQQLACDVALVLDRSGHVLARTDRAGGVGQDFSRVPIVAEAMQHGEGTGLWNDGDRYWTATAVPLVSGGEAVEGYLVTGLALDDQLALDVRRQSGAEVAFVAFAPAMHVVASTLGEDQDLVAALEHHPELGARVSGADGGGAGVPLTLAGHPWLVHAAPFGAARPGAPTPIAAVTLASLDRAIAPFRRIEAALLGVAALALMLAFVLAWSLSRRVARPLAQLADAADAARAGHYDRPLPVCGDDEVGRVARAFDGLLGELREERELEQYLQALSRSLPDTPPAPPADDGVAPAGTVLAGRFEVLAWIGSGGAGVVYKARDRQLNDVVALKTLRREALSADTLEALKAELRTARRITHRNVLRTHDFGEAGGVPFISMEYVRGVTLRGLLDHSGRLPIAAAIRIGRQLLAALEAAHELGVVHLDVKPENLILDPAGGVRLMDFGIARLTRGPERTRTPEALMGTIGYVSPEQLAGAPGDHRSDLYACGVVLYEMLAGRQPFTASDPNELYYRIMNEDPPGVRTLAPDVPPALERVVATCLARDPTRRFADAKALSAALAAAGAPGTVDAA